jgi:DNA ligase-1
MNETLKTELNPRMRRVSEGRWDEISTPELNNMVFPVLYKVSGTGAILEWYVSVQPAYLDHPGGHPGDACGFDILITHGQKGGQLIQQKETVTEGKNLGRANETTPLQQAVFQAVARWKKQVDCAYRVDIEDAKKAAKAANKPMLAYKFLERGQKSLFDKKTGEKKVSFVALQPKVDGMRCLATMEEGWVTLKSRGGKPIDSVPHIVTELELVMEEGETWDGELYVHGMAFEKIMSICKRKAKNLHPEHETMEFHVFDVVADGGYLERTKGVLWRDDGAPARAEGHARVVVVPWVTENLSTYEVLEKRMMTHLAFQESQGYEGVMLRRIDVEYQHRKCADLLKLKSFQDEEFVIVGTETGTAGTAKDGLLVNFLCQTAGDDPKGFKAPLCGSEQLLQEMWERRDTYVGELATCMFQEKTKYGVPRFPKCKGVRGREDLS